MLNHLYLSLVLHLGVPFKVVIVFAEDELRHFEFLYSKMFASGLWFILKVLEAGDKDQLLFFPTLVRQYITELFIFPRLDVLMLVVIFG